jgi:hypothetical protein
MTKLTLGKLTEQAIKNLAPLPDTTPLLNAMYGNGAFNEYPLREWAIPICTTDALKEVTKAAVALSRTMEATAELRPPPERANKMWHWVRMEGADPMPVQWSSEFWWTIWRKFSPREAARYAWHYLGPAEWREPGMFDGVRDPVLDNIAVVISEARAIITGKDTRIAELETEVARLHGMLAGRLSVSVADALAVMRSVGTGPKQAEPAPSHAPFLIGETVSRISLAINQYIIDNDGVSPEYYEVSHEIMRKLQEEAGPHALYDGKYGGLLMLGIPVVPIGFVGPHAAASAPQQKTPLQAVVRRAFVPTPEYYRCKALERDAAKASFVDPTEQPAPSAKRPIPLRALKPGNGIPR